MAISHYTLLNIHKDNTECRGAQNPQSELGYIAPDSLFCFSATRIDIKRAILPQANNHIVHLLGCTRHSIKLSEARKLSRHNSVQEKDLWGTNRTPKRVRYRRWASGVRTALRNVFGTGDGSLGGTERDGGHGWYTGGASEARNGA